MQRAHAYKGDETMTPFDEGALAWDHGEFYDMNPYTENTNESDEWERGYYGEYSRQRAHAHRETKQ